MYAILSLFFNVRCTYIHTYIHTYAHTYIHTHMHIIYIYVCVCIYIYNVVHTHDKTETHREEGKVTRQLTLIHFFHQTFENI